MSIFGYHPFIDPCIHQFYAVFYNLLELNILCRGNKKQRTKVSAVKQNCTILDSGRYSEAAASHNFFILYLLVGVFF